MCLCVEVRYLQPLSSPQKDTLSEGLLEVIHLCIWNVCVNGLFYFLYKIVHTDVYTCVCEGKRSSRANCHFYKIYLFRYWLATCVCLWVCVSYVFSYAGQKKLLVHLELEVKMVVSCHMVSWSFTVATSAFYHGVISIAALIYF